MNTSRPLAIAVFVVLTASSVAGIEHVTLDRDGRQIHLAGRIEVEAQDGGLLLLTRDGVLWAIQPDELVRRVHADIPFDVLGRDELVKATLRDLPAGFRVHHTAHYAIFYNTSRAYAQWCGALYERLYRGFNNYWTRRGLPLHEPPAPLVALVFDRKRSYAQYAREELGDAVRSIVGYYSLRTNRITTFDLTGLEQVRPSGRIRRTSDHINRILAQPNARPTVATIVHEATHQLAFNCGLQTRYADVPLWLSEGIAVYFETPDLSSSRGWRGIGTVNRSRLTQFRRYLGHRPDDSLVTLLRDDARLRDADHAADAYAESWALCYFLLHRYAKQFPEYLKALSKKQPLHYDRPEERLELFRSTFHRDLTDLDREFLRYINNLR